MAELLLVFEKTKFPFLKCIVGIGKESTQNVGAFGWERPLHNLYSNLGKTHFPP